MQISAKKLWFFQLMKNLYILGFADLFFPFFFISFFFFLLVSEVSIFVHYCIWLTWIQLSRVDGYNLSEYELQSCFKTHFKSVNYLKHLHCFRSLYLKTPSVGCTDFCLFNDRVECLLIIYFLWCTNYFNVYLSE